MAKQTAPLTTVIENKKSATSYAEAIRPFRIEIEVLSDDCVFSFHQIRHAVVDGKVSSSGTQEAATVRSSVMEKIVTVEDPILRKTVTISVEGLLTAINALHHEWYLEDVAAKGE